ncbi:MAG TPA: hypothetical protein VGW76_13790 [Pyrinomonadaceae bacterium]|nr:hypothetical protein [Pyrinomonadaceae bacterium]
MPLNNSDLQTIPADPDVRIFLHGQLILQPGEDGECKIGINRCSPIHQFSFEVRQRMNDPNSPDIILSRRLGTLRTDIEIDLEDSTGEGVTKFVPDVPFGQANDFRWLIDLAGPSFHDCPVEFTGIDIEPEVIIREGLFYTAARTDASKLSVVREGGGKTRADLGTVAAIMGVNIYLEGRRLKVAYGEEELMLPPPDAPAGVTYYEIRISNDPPFVDQEEDTPTIHDEFREYYKAVKCLKIDGQEVEDFLRFKLLVQKIRTPGLGSPTIPCMPIGDGP